MAVIDRPAYGAAGGVSVSQPQNGTYWPKTLYGRPNTSSVFHRGAQQCLRSCLKTLLGWQGLDRREAPVEQSPGFRKAPTRLD